MKRFSASVRCSLYGVIELLELGWQSNCEDMANVLQAILNCADRLNVKDKYFAVIRIDEQFADAAYPMSQWFNREINVFDDSNFRLDEIEDSEEFNILLTTKDVPPEIAAQAAFIVSLEEILAD